MAQRCSLPFPVNPQGYLPSTHPLVSRPPFPSAISGSQCKGTRRKRPLLGLRLSRKHRSRWVSSWLRFFGASAFQGALAYGPDLGNPQRVYLTEPNTAWGAGLVLEGGEERTALLWFRLEFPGCPANKTLRDVCSDQTTGWKNNSPKTKLSSTSALFFAPIPI